MKLCVCKDDDFPSAYHIQVYILPIVLVHTINTTSTNTSTTTSTLANSLEYIILKLYK